MSRQRTRGVTVVCGVLAYLHALAAEPALPMRIKTAAFGTIAVFKPTQAEPDSFALLVSDDDSRNRSGVNIARALAAKGALVTDIDVRRFLAVARARSACQPLATDLELLSHQIQKRIGVREYHLPVLVGYASGAALVYAALAQAPAGTFGGAISMDFCPQQEYGGAVCPAAQLRYTQEKKGALVFEPAPHLEQPWIVLQGMEDRACSAQVVSQFVARTGGAALVRLPAVTHGSSEERDWMPPLLAAYQSIAMRPEAAAAQAPEILDLPVTTVRAAQESATLALLLTGDGGWAGIDRELAARLAAQGVATVGFNSLRYFWHQRTPDEAARDVARVLEHFLAEWNKTRFILIGYSFGANVAPFVVNRLPSPLRKRLTSVSLLGIEPDADFVVRVADWIPGAEVRGRDVRPELAAIEVPVQCIYAAGASTICPATKSGRVVGERVGSGAHFGGDYAAIADRILAFAGIMSHHN